MEAYQEMGRVIGLILKSLVSGKRGLAIPSFVILLAGPAWVIPRELSAVVTAIPVDGRWILIAVLQCSPSCCCCSPFVR